ncbi:MAG: hypothetical protein ACN6N7_04400 [Chryseobacterium culicis]
MINEIYKELYEKIDSKSISPHWQIDKNKIEFGILTHGLPSNFFDNDFTIIRDVSFEDFFEVLDPHNQTQIKLNLHDDEGNSELKFNEIISYWTEERKLIPPIVVIYDEEYMKRLDIHSTTFNHLNILDGNHRLKMCYKLDSSEITLIALNWQVEKVLKLLKR